MCTSANLHIDLETFTGQEYALMNLNNQHVPFRVASGKDGRIWVITGSDSGFERTTAVYYDAIDIQLTEVA